MKSLAKNSLYNVIYKCLAVVFPLITSAYVSRVLLVDGIGKVNSAQNIVQYFVILAALGLPTYGTKVIAAVSKDKEQLNRTFTELFIINGLSTMICTFAYYALVLSISYFADRRLLFIVSGLLIPLNVINVDWYYQGKEEYKYIMFRSLAVKSLAFICTFIFVKTEDDYISYAGLMVFANAANYIFNIVHLNKYTKLDFHGIDLKKHLKPVFVLLAASIAIEVYTLADTTMLTFMSGDSSVGMYSNSMRIIRIIKNMVVAVAAVYLPRLSYYYANDQQDQFLKLVQNGLKILLLAAVPCAIGIMLVSSDLVPLLFGKPFAPASVTTSILAISIVTVAISNFIGYQVLVTIGKEKIMFYSTLMGAIMNIILNYFLIKQWTFNGAAVASVMTEFSIAIFQFIAMHRYISIKIESKYLGSILISSIVMYVLTIITKTLISNLLIRLFVSVIVGVISYTLCLFITRNEYVEYIVGIIKRRISK